MNLVGGLVAMFYFPIQLGIIIPIDVHIFRRGSNHQPDIMFPFSSSLAPPLALSHPPWVFTGDEESHRHPAGSLGGPRRASRRRTCFFFRKDLGRDGKEWKRFPQKDVFLIGFWAWNCFDDVWRWYDDFGYFSRIY